MIWLQPLILSPIFLGFLLIGLPRIFLSIRIERRDALPLSLGLIWILTAHPFQLKILLDEYIVYAQSQSLHEQGTAAVHEFGSTLGPDLVRMEPRLDKRPVTFPLVVSILHRIWGETLINVWIASSLFLLLLVASLQTIARKLDPQLPTTGILTLILVSIPLISSTATSGGLDLPNVSLLAATIALALIHRDEKSIKSGLGLVFTAILLANTRYESLLFLPPAAIFAWWLIRGQKYAPATLLVAFIGMVPVAGLVFLQLTTTQMQQFADNETQIFSFAFFPNNAASLFEFLAIPDRANPANPFLCWLTLPVAGLGFLGLRRAQSISPHQKVLIAAILLITLRTLAVLCFNYGDALLHSQHRLFLPEYLALILVFLFLWSQLTRFKPGRVIARIISVVLLLSIIGWSVPVSTHAIYETKNYFGREIEWARNQILPNHDPAFERVFSHRPVVWIAHGVPAVTIAKVGLLIHSKPNEENTYYIEIPEIYDPPSQRWVPRFETPDLEALGLDFDWTYSPSFRPFHRLALGVYQPVEQP